MKIDGKEVLERLAAAKKQDRTKVSLYLSKSLYEDFKQACGDIPASVVLEDLIQQFLASAPAPLGRKAKR